MYSLGEHGYRVIYRGLYGKREYAKVKIKKSVTDFSVTASYLYIYYSLWNL